MLGHSAQRKHQRSTPVSEHTDGGPCPGPRPSWSCEAHSQPRIGAMLLLFTGGRSAAQWWWAQVMLTHPPGRFAFRSPAPPPLLPPAPLPTAQRTLPCPLKPDNQQNPTGLDRVLAPRNQAAAHTAGQAAQCTGTACGERGARRLAHPTGHPRHSGTSARGRRRLLLIRTDAL